MPDSLTLMSLNVGRLLQERTTAYLEALNHDKDVPDVLCIQDLPFDGLPLLERWPHVSFAPMTNHFINGERAVVGIAIASRYFMSNIYHHTTWGNGVLKDLQGINEKNERYLGAESDALVEASEDRVLVCATIWKGKASYDIATTHGMWVRDGVVNDVQRTSTESLLSHLRYEGYSRQGLVLIADMNMSRGGEIYNMVTGVMRDCMPETIDTTLDPSHGFSKRGGKVVTDYVMTSPAPRRDPYRVSDVRLLPGVSDHQALLATIEKE